MAFGRKSWAPAPAQLEAPRMVRREYSTPDRMMPEELLEQRADIGRMLKLISAPDATNKMMSEEACRALLERQRKMMEAFIEAINDTLPAGVEVVPLFMLPEQCWNSLHRPFLLRVLQVTPYGSWNLLPLPKDEASAQALGLNLPRWVPDPHYIEGVIEHIGGLGEDVRKISGEIQKALAAGKPPGFSRASEAEDEVRRKLRGIGFYIASEMVGGETLTRSRRLFFGEVYDPAPEQHARAEG